MYPCGECASGHGIIGGAAARVAFSRRCGVCVQPEPLHGGPQTSRRRWLRPCVVVRDRHKVRREQSERAREGDVAVCSSAHTLAHRVNLPGLTPTQPNIYDFGVSYQSMYEQLKSADEGAYSRNGVLQMLSRNARVKVAPERWQDERSREFDIVITYEERVFDAVVEDLEERGSKDFANVHLLGLDVRDNHTEAETGAQQTVQLLQMLLDAGDEWEDQLDTILESFTRKTDRAVCHNIAFY